MANPIEIRLTSNATDVIKDAKKAGESYQDFGDSLNDVARQAQKTGTALDSKIGGGAKNAQSDIKKLEAEFNELATSSQRDVQSSAKSFEVSEGEKRRAVRETLHEVKDEAKQNASETFSSFDGSVGSFVDGIQGTFGGIISSLGPVGAAVGVAGSLAIGAIAGSLQKADENSQQFKQDVMAYTQALIESGAKGKVSVDYVVSELQKLATETDASQVSLAKLYDTSKKSGSSYKDLSQAYAGNVDKLQELRREAKYKLENDQTELDLLKGKEQQAGNTSYSVNAALDSQTYKQQKLTDAEQQYSDYLDKAGAKYDAAAKQRKLYAEAGGPEMEQANKALQAQQSDLENAADSWDSYWDSAKNTFDVAGYLKAQSDEIAKQDYVSNALANSSLSDEAKGHLQQEGTDAAYAQLKGYQAASPDQQNQLNQVWTRIGQDNGQKYVANFNSSVSNSTPPTLKVLVESPDFKGIIAKAQNYVDQHPIYLKPSDAKFGRGLV